MTVHEPQEMNAALATAYNSGQVDSLLELYEADAVLAPQPGSRVSGTTELRTALTELLSLGGTMRSQNQLCIRFENIALLRAEWTIAGIDADDSPTKLGGMSAEIVRQQADGRWLYVVDHPFGSDQQ